MPTDDPDLQKSLNLAETVIISSHSTDGDPQLTFLTPIPNGEECYSCHGQKNRYRGVVKVTTSLSSMQRDVRTTWIRAANILGLSVAAVGFLTFFMLRRVVLRPIRTVTLAMTRAAQGDLSQEVPIPSMDEVGVMADHFNTMLKRLRETYQGLQKEQDKLSTIILSATEGIVVTDREGKVVLVNPAAERILEKTSQQIIGEGFPQLVDDPSYINAYLQSWGADMPETIFYKNKLINMNISTIQDDENRIMGSAALFRDVTDEKRLEEQLRQLSFTDGLTGLLNRRRMEEVLREELSRASRYNQKVSLVLLDVDHFKKFNDQYGHDQGDRVLIAMARIMKEHFRTNDLCCRYGGEEFCVIMPNTDTPGAFYGADRFRQKVEATNIDGLKVTITAGIAIFPRHGSEPDALLKQADLALYQGKQEGRNRVIIVPE
ncbi:MAG: diguanylate cyclase [Magnetococcales bacterium]|nr:diguanylate cyclase [Magnetococcales bacterium]